MRAFTHIHNPYIRLALRLARPGTGSAPAFLDRRTAVLPLPDLHAILGELRWVIVGGMAIRAYAAERMTLDVDILIDAHDELPARAAFERAGYQITGALSVGGFTAERGQGQLPVDVLTSRAGWLDWALQQPVRDLAGYPVLARPYLILLKLQSGRAQDIADITRLLRSADQQERDRSRALIGQELPDQVEDFDALVALTDLEFGAP